MQLVFQKENYSTKQLQLLGSEEAVKFMLLAKLFSSYFFQAVCSCLQPNRKPLGLSAIMVFGASLLCTVHLMLMWKQL